MSTPSRLHQAGSSACSASMKAATPPFRWACGDSMQGDRRLATRFRAEKLDHASARQPFPTQRQVQRQGPRRDPLDLHVRALTQLHDGPGPKRLLDLADRVVKRLLLGRQRRLDSRSFPVAWPRRSLLPHRLDYVRKNSILASGSSFQGGASDFLPASRAG